MSGRGRDWGTPFLHKGWRWLDLAVSRAVSLAILWGIWGFLREALNLALDAVPEHVNAEEADALLTGPDGVREVHDLHVWAMSTAEVALTAHHIIDGTSCDLALLREVARELHEPLLHSSPTNFVEFVLAKPVVLWADRCRIVSPRLRCVL